MKPTLKYICTGMALCTGLTSLTAESKKTNPEKATDKEATADPFKVDTNIQIYLEYIEMPLLTMAELMNNKKATDTDSALRSRVTDLIKNEKATLVDLQLLTVPDGHKAATASIQEFIYPTEYEPAELPGTVHLHSGNGHLGIISKNFATGPNPTAFETRNLGNTLEVEATLDPDAPYIRVRLAPEISYFVKNEIYSHWKDERSQADIVMPILYTLRVSAEITATDGVPILVTTLSPQNNQGVADHTRKILVFLKATIIKP